MSRYLLDYQASQLLAFNDTVNKIFPNPFSDYLRKHMIEIEEISTKIWSAIAVPFSAVCVVSATSVTLLRAIAKVSPEAQEKLNDKALFWGLIAFVYSRALSMIG
jgi:hypothetical protein